MTREFSFRPEDYESGPHTIVVTASDFAGNEKSESFEVTSADPPEPTCPGAPTPGVTVNPLPADPSQARAELESPRGFPPATQGMSRVTLDGASVQPALDSSDPAKFVSRESVTGSEVDRQAVDGASISVSTWCGPVCLAPTTVSLGASAPPPAINDTAALYANSHPATDTVVRPSPAGVEVFAQLRAAIAPKEFGWHVALQPGQELRRLPSGEVAVVVPASPGAEAPDSGVALSPEPTLAQRQQAVTDTALALDLAGTLLERAQSLTADEIVALIPAPWARDAQQRNVPSSLVLEGQMVKLKIDHDALRDQFPVTAAAQVLTAEGADEIETAKSSEDIADYTDEEAESFDPSTVAADGPPAEDPPGPGDDETEPDAVAGSWNDGDDLEGYSTEDDPPSADATTTLPTAEMSRRIADFGLGFTETDPVNLADPRQARLGTRFHRPFVPWNVDSLRRSKNPRQRRKYYRWVDYYETAKDLELKLDVALTRSRDVPKGAQGTSAAAPPSTNQYRKAVKLFFKNYGDVVKNLMPWNEPNFNRDPLYNHPLKAAQFWIIAEHICHPRTGPRRCSFVVAGDYAGGLLKKEHKPPVRGRAKRKRYSRWYHDFLTSRRKHPRVWAYHNYGDWKAYALNVANGEAAQVSARYYEQYRQDSYRYRDPGDGQRKLPRIWLTETGIPYHFSCQRGLTLGLERKHCGGFNRQADRDGNETNTDSLLLGMVKQRQTMAFMLRKLAKDSPAIKRIYFLRLHGTKGNIYPKAGGQSSGDCKPPRSNAEPYCPLNDTSLIGQDDDETYTHDYPEPLSRAPGRSQPNQRRLAFCLLEERDTKPFQIKNPGRQRSCPP